MQITAAFADAAVFADAGVFVAPIAATDAPSATTAVATPAAIFLRIEIILDQFFCEDSKDRDPDHKGMDGIRMPGEEITFVPPGYKQRPFANGRGALSPD